jgi:outer membrane protein assembly factor BamB
MQTNSQPQTRRSFRAVLSRREAIVSGGVAAFGAVLVPGATDASTPTPAAIVKPVPIYRGDAERTGVMPGPAPDGVPEVLWRTQASGEVRTGIVVGAELVYAGSEDGFVTALDIETGAARWTFDTGAPEGSPFSVLDGDRLFVAGSDGHARALNALTGEVIWTSPDELALSIAVVPGEDVLYVGGIDPYFVALSTDDGSMVWRSDLPSEPGGRSPVYLNGTLYTGTGDGQLLAQNGTDGSQLWATATGNAFVGSLASFDGLIIGPGGYDDVGGLLFAIDAETGALLWTVEDQQGWSPATGYGDLIIAQGQGGTWQGLSRTDGVLVWEFAPDEPMEVGGPVSIVGDTAYLIGRNRVLYAIDARTGTHIWDVTLDGDMNYSPAVTGGRIYVGTWFGGIYALGASAGAPATPAS